MQSSEPSEDSWLEYITPEKQRPTYGLLFVKSKAQKDKKQEKSKKRNKQTTLPNISVQTSRSSAQIVQSSDSLDRDMQILSVSRHIETSERIPDEEYDRWEKMYELAKHSNGRDTVLRQRGG